jgi:sodium-dependent phosphate cotransporter
MQDASGKVTSYYSCPSGADCTTTSYFSSGVGRTSLTAGVYYNVCKSSKMSTTKCDARLLKGGLAYDTWDMSDREAGTTLTILSLAALCATLFCIVYVLQIVVKGPAARMLKKAVGLNGYLNMAIGCGITILVQSSSITTSTLTPIAAVGLITHEEMFPLTLGANVGTTLSGIMAATVVTSNPVQAWQVALTHFFFNVFSIVLIYPLPVTRAIPLAASRWLGRMTAHETYGKIFPLVYTGVVFLAIPGICYGIAVAATS